MDYRNFLLQPIQLRYIDQLVLEVEQNPQDFIVVFQLIFDTDANVAWRAAWACGKIALKHADWFTDNHFMELAALATSTSQGGLHRGCLSILTTISIPKPIPVELLNSCFEWMVSPRFPIAVQALSMKLLYQFCMIEPELIPELRAYLELITPEDYSKGYVAARNKVLKKLIAK